MHALVYVLTSHTKVELDFDKQLPRNINSLSSVRRRCDLLKSGQGH